MIGMRLNTARAVAGLSMQGLADKVGVSANMIKKYEHNESMPSSSVLLKLSKSLGVKSEYFFRPTSATLQGVEYRKRSTLTKKLQTRIEADVLDQADRWLELSNLWPDFPVSQFATFDYLPVQVATYDEVENISMQIRSAWKFGNNAIPDLIDTLEGKGILVIVTSIEVDKKLDGLQATVSGKPVIVVSSGWPGDRQRFTLAHELGHLALHGRLSPDLDEEMACNRFASSFLFPAEQVRKHLGASRHTLEPRELYYLKFEFGISMAACLRRALDLSIVSPSTYEKLNRLFAINGWKKKEPGDVYKQENTILFDLLVYRALAEGIIGESKAAELLKQSLVDFRKSRRLECLNALAD